MNSIEWIIPQRLARHVDPWVMLDVKREDLSHAQPVAEFVTDAFDDQRTRDYDRGRIIYFAELYLSGYHLDPLTVDNECSRSEIFPVSVLLDGYHRLCAALLTNKRKIPVHYSGRLDVLHWLQGTRLRCPAT